MSAMQRSCPQRIYTYVLTVYSRCVPINRLFIFLLGVDGLKVSAFSALNLNKKVLSSETSGEDKNI